MSSAASPGRRRGFWPAVALAILLVATIPAEFIANDRPLLVSYVGYLYSPVLHDYPETKFGGDFETTADFTDGYLRFQIERHGWMLWPLIPFSYASSVTDLPEPAPTPPSHRNWLGTDTRQRDVLARLIYSVRASLLLALSIFAICGATTALTKRRIAGVFYLPAIAVAAIAALDLAGHWIGDEGQSLGALLREGLMNPSAPWLSLTGGVALAGILALLILLGRALESARKSF
jgi:ABC-type microcin C transport system permease subunit YejE